MTFGIRIIMLEEFYEPGCGDTTGEFVCDLLLETVEAEPDDVWWYWLVLIAQFIVLRLIAVILLHKKASKFF